MNMVGSPTPHHMNFSFIPVCTISDEQPEMPEKTNLRYYIPNLLFSKTNLIHHSISPKSEPQSSSDLRNMNLSTTFRRDFFIACGIDDTNHLLNRQRADNGTMTRNKYYYSTIS